MSPGSGARAFFYFTNWLLAVVALSLSAVVVHDSPVHEQHWKGAIVILVSSALAMVTFVILLSCFRIDRNAKLSELYGETFILLTIWALFLGGSITLSTRWATGVGCNIKPPTKLCREYRALLAFSWIHWSVLFFLLGIVVGLGIVMHDDSKDGERGVGEKSVGGGVAQAQKPTMWDRVETRRLEKERAAASPPPAA